MSKFYCYKILLINIVLIYNHSVLLHLWRGNQPALFYRAFLRWHQLSRLAVTAKRGGCTGGFK